MPVVNVVDDFLIDRIAQPVMDILQDRGIITAPKLARAILMGAYVAGMWAAVGEFLKPAVETGTAHVGSAALNNIIAFVILVSALGVYIGRRRIGAVARPGTLPRERVTLFKYRLSWLWSVLGIILIAVGGGWSNSYESWDFVAFASLSLCGFYVASCGNNPGASRRRQGFMLRGLPQGA